jgi:hypothetical protein
VIYHPVVDYYNTVRSLLQDKIVPYRYADQDIIDALNAAMAAISRVRPDIFLDLKYQTRLWNGDLRDGVPDLFLTSDIVAGTIVPIPSDYVGPCHWYCAGWLQLYDVTDTQDQRAAAFLERSKSIFLGLSL